MFFFTDVLPMFGGCLIRMEFERGIKNTRSVRIILMEMIKHSHGDYEHCCLSLFPSSLLHPAFLRYSNESGHGNIRTQKDSSDVQKMDVNAVVKEKLIPDQRLHLNDKLRIGVGKALELVLVQIHDKEFIRRSQVHCHLGELLVEVAGVAAIFLEI